MELEEQTLDRAGDRCEECGARLTPDELEAVIESGGPTLCKIHAAEQVPVSEDEAAFGEPA
jgi:methionyl-tRNA synthetase